MAGSVGDYRPEKSARVFLSDGSWTVAADLFREVVLTPDGPVDDIPRQLGELVRRELAAVEPRWPTVRQACVKTLADGRWLVVAVSGEFPVAGASTRPPSTWSSPALATACWAASPFRAHRRDDCGGGAPG